MVPPEGMCAFTDLTAVLQTGKLTRAQQWRMAHNGGPDPHTLSGTLSFQD